MTFKRTKGKKKKNQMERRLQSQRTEFKTNEKKKVEISLSNGL